MPEPTSSADLHPAFADVLRLEREALNRRFAERQRAEARISEIAFHDHLRTVVNDLVGNVARVLPERVRTVVDALFDVSLDLFAAGLLGTEMRHPHVQAAWREVLPAAAGLLAREPSRVAGCVSNAADHLAAHPAARPPEWIDGMRRLAPHCDSVSQWLEAGKLLAWRAGMVQYRAAALDIAAALPWKLAARCFDLPNNHDEADWRSRLDRMKSDRWYEPAAHIAKRTLRLVRTTGGFRGFGGPCLWLPTVTSSDAGLFVSAGEDCWQLLADVFGTLWLRVPNSAIPKGTRRTGSPVMIDAQGNVAWEGTHPFGELAEPSSHACDGQTLAVTLPTSYHVFLVAWAA